MKEIFPKTNSKRRSLNDYYFQIDYTISQAICQPVSIFHGKNAINTIRALVKKSFLKITNVNLSVSLDNPRIKWSIESQCTNPFKCSSYQWSSQIIRKTYWSNVRLKWNEKQNDVNVCVCRGVNKTERLLCSYVLELTVVINFPSTCDNECQQSQIDSLTTNRNLFGDLPNSSLKFSLPDVTLPDAPVVFFIHNFAICKSNHFPRKSFFWKSSDVDRTTKYLEKAAFIQSIASNRFVSTKYFHSNINQSFVSMAVKEKSLFVIKRGLEQMDSSSVYVSFLSLSIPNLYLRHQDGTIKLAKNDQSSLFRQDATFKLIFDHRNDIVAFQAVNIPGKFYMTLSADFEPTLILVPCDAEPSTDRIDSRSLFKFIVASWTKLIFTWTFFLSFLRS